jgi:hypothetical protein
MAKIGTSHLGRIVLRFSHEALTPLRSVSSTYTAASDLPPEIG